MCDLKCPGCNKRLSKIMDEGMNIFIQQEDWGYSWECGNCGAISFWNSTIADVPIQCDVDGNPLN